MTLASSRLASQTSSDTGFFYANLAARSLRAVAHSPSRGQILTLSEYPLCPENRCDAIECFFDASPVQASTRALIRDTLGISTHALKRAPLPSHHHDPIHGNLDVVLRARRHHSQRLGHAGDALVVGTATRATLTSEYFCTHPHPRCSFPPVLPAPATIPAAPMHISHPIEAPKFYCARPTVSLSSSPTAFLAPTLAVSLTSSLAPSPTSSPTAFIAPYPTIYHRSPIAFPFFVS